MALPPRLSVLPTSSRSSPASSRPAGSSGNRQTYLDASAQTGPGPAPVSRPCRSGCAPPPPACLPGLRGAQRPLPPTQPSRPTGRQETLSNAMLRPRRRPEPGPSHPQSSLPGFLRLSSVTSSPASGPFSTLARGFWSQRETSCLQIWLSGPHSRGTAEMYCLAFWRLEAQGQCVSRAGPSEP